MKANHNKNEVKTIFERK